MVIERKRENCRDGDSMTKEERKDKRERERDLRYTKARY